MGRAARRPAPSPACVPVLLRVCQCRLGVFWRPAVRIGKSRALTLTAPPHPISAPRARPCASHLARSALASFMLCVQVPCARSAPLLPCASGRRSESSQQTSCPRARTRSSAGATRYRRRPSWSRALTWVTSSSTAACRWRRLPWASPRRAALMLALRRQPRRRRPSPGRVTLLLVIPPRASTSTRRTHQLLRPSTTLARRLRRPRPRLASRMPTASGRKPTARRSRSARPRRACARTSSARRRRSGWPRWRRSARECSRSATRTTCATTRSQTTLSQAPSAPPGASGRASSTCGPKTLL